MAEIIWTEPALDNLNDIAEYIAVSNPIAASKLVSDVFEAVSRLENHPSSGRVPQELASLPYREVVVNPCRVFYKLEDHAAVILFVMRQEQDLRKYLLEFPSGR